MAWTDKDAAELQQLVDRATQLVGEGQLAVAEAKAIRDYLRLPPPHRP